MKPNRIGAPEGRLSTFARERFEHEGIAHDIFRKGTGPAVLVLTEIPGISPQVLGFADTVASHGFTAVLPDLFGTAGLDPLGSDRLGIAVHTVKTIVSTCVSREFTAFAAGTSSPVVRFLRHLAATAHARCGGPGVGVVGMCFTGGFALAMAVDPLVLAPVMSQPSLPMALVRSHHRAIDCSDGDLAIVAGRCAKEGLTVLGLRFRGDPFVPGDRFAFLREKLGSGFVAVELDQTSRHPRNPLPFAHSVLTADLIDEPGEPTRAALDTVLDLMKAKLLVASSQATVT